MLAILLTLCLASSAFAMPAVQNERFISGLLQTMFDMGMAMLEQHLGFSLTDLWNTVLAIGGAVYDTFVNVIAQLVFASQAVWAQVTPIFTQLMTDLINHASDASYYIMAALGQVQGVLSSVGRRDLKNQHARFISNLLDFFGLTGVWDTIVALGNNIVLQFTTILTQLLFAGQAVLAQVTPIFTQLATDLVNHAQDALPLVTAALGQVTGILQG